MLGIESSDFYFCHYRTCTTSQYTVDTFKYSPSNTHPGASVSEITNQGQYFDMMNYSTENYKLYM